MICTSQLPCGCKRPSSGGSPKSSCLGSVSLVTSCLYFARRRWINHDEHQIWLVVSTPLKNISQLRLLFPIYGKIKNVPNHQPEIVSNFKHMTPEVSAKQGFGPLSPGRPWQRPSCLAGQSSLSSPWKASILGDAPCSHNPHLQARMLIETGALSEDQFTLVWSHHTHPQRRLPRSLWDVDRMLFGIFWDLLIDTFQQPRHSPRKTRMAACSGNLGLLLWVCFLKKIWAALTSKCCKRSSAQIYLTAVARSCSPLKVDQCPLAVMCFLTGAGSLPEAGGNMSHPQTSTIVDRWKLSAPKCDDSLVTEIKTIQNL